MHYYSPSEPISSLLGNMVCTCVSASELSRFQCRATSILLWSGLLAVIHTLRLYYCITEGLLMLWQSQTWGSTYMCVVNFECFSASKGVDLNADHAKCRNIQLFDSFWLADWLSAVYHRYVGNLDPSVTEELLVTLFGKLGSCKGCKIIREVCYVSQLISVIYLLFYVSFLACIFVLWQKF